MALIASDLVTPRASFPTGSFGQEAPSYGGSGVPLIGVVESVSGSDIKVDWSNGDVVTYSDAGANTLLQVLAAQDPSLYHKMVRFNPTLNNVYGSGIGLVIALFSVVVSTTRADFAVVKFEDGDVILFSSAGFVEVPSNPNVTG